MATANQVFAVIATRGADRVREALAQQMSGDSVYELKSDVWLVSYEGTTRKLAEALGIRGGESGTGLVFPIGGYSGRASNDVWEWLKLHWPADAWTSTRP